MLNISKICRILLAAAFVCIFEVNMVEAQLLLPEEKNSWTEAPDWENLVLEMPGTTTTQKDGNTIKKEVYYDKDGNKTTLKTVTGPAQNYVETDLGAEKKHYINKDEVSEEEQNAKRDELTSANKQETPTTGVAVNTTQSAGAVSGCSGDLGLFSGLITTGKTIFKGMRDLIYVVAGFGIIGVAVGGFFGNLNWKWLGAIIIGLVVIATTGELITAITGCEDFTPKLIQDTLK